MPTSDCSNIPFVVDQLQKLRPKRILDVGVGFGKWGVLAREYLDVWYGRFRIEERTVRIEGIEIHAPYRNPIWDAVYDVVHVGDARQIIDGLGQYDVAILCDVIEHFEKDDGRALLEALLGHCKFVLITTPVDFWAQGAVGGNSHERHLSLWTYQDFQPYSGLCVDLGATFGAVVSIKEPSEAAMVVQRRHEELGVRQLLKLLARGVRRKLARQQRGTDRSAARREI
jgi:hypothetical protein